MKNKLRIERAILGLRQEDLARRISVSRQTIHAIESGKYIPSTLLALRIARVFDKPVESLFQLEEGDLPPEHPEREN